MSDGGNSSNFTDLLARTRCDAEALRRSLRNPLDRLDHCRDLIGLKPRKRSDQKVFNVGVGRATKVLGIAFKPAQALLSRPQCGNTFDEAFAQLPTGCPVNAVGAVYIATMPDAPGVYKIGFTTNLVRRRYELRAEYGSALQITAAEAGTYVSEFAAQRRVGARWLLGEWFSSNVDPQYCPDFLRKARGTPQRELAEYYFALASGPIGAEIPNAGPFCTITEAETALAAGRRR